MDDIHPLIEELQRAQPHDVPAVELRETHISWILLAGEFAYKIKKPVNLGFLDFSTLERRRHFCEQELRLNRRFAPDLYLDVVPITGTPHEPRLTSHGPIIDYAVRMRRFSEDDLFSRLIADGRLAARHIDSLAAEVARFHASADVAPDNSDWGSPDENQRVTLDNIRVLQSDPEAPTDQVAELEVWTRTQANQLHDVFLQRRAAGFVRECHGDLHLGNIVLLNDRATLFDGIEFNDAYRWIDILSDAAFVVMDLADRGRRNLSWRFLNAYLEVTGDYAGVQLLPWFLVYRSLVRAKVASIRSRQDDVTPQERTHRREQVTEYVRLAIEYSRRRRPALHITHGLSGSGKTFGTTRLLESIGAIRVRSDVERTRHARPARQRGDVTRTHDSPKRKRGDVTFDVDQVEASLAAQDVDPDPCTTDDAPDIANKYSPEQAHDTYQRLKTLARGILAAGFPAIVDATFLKRAHRADFQSLANELHLPFHILPFTADESALKSRIAQRHAEGRDASEATLAVLEQQLATIEPLDPADLNFCTSPDALIAEFNGPTH